MKEQIYRCRTPIVFIFFNRPDTMNKVLEQITKVKPKKLYLIADGPRNEKEKKTTDYCRKIAEEAITWKCEVIKVYSEKNLGCCDRIYSGITYAFQNEEKLIILEDDIVPSISFFRYQDELLEKYIYEEQIFSVSGFNEFDYLTNIKEDCFLVNQFAVWGWGTWKRAWRNVDIYMEEWKLIEGHPRKLKLYNIDKKAARIEYVNWLKTYHGYIDSWGYRVLFYFFEHNKYSIMPRYSLTQNIGSGDKSTHTYKLESRLQSIVAHEINFPLQFSDMLNYQNEWIQEYFKIYFHDGYYKKRIIYYVKEGINSIIYKIFKKSLKIEHCDNGLYLTLKKLKTRKPNRNIIEQIIHQDDMPTTIIEDNNVM